MYVIVKQVAQFKYYWNENQCQWEGLIDNATAMELGEAKDLQRSRFSFKTELINL